MPSILTNVRDLKRRKKMKLIFQKKNLKIVVFITQDTLWDLEYYGWNLDDEIEKLFSDF